MKYYLKGAIGITAMLVMFAVGIIVSPRNKADALATLDAKKTELQTDILPLMQEYSAVRKELCEKIAQHGGECKQDVFGSKIAEALASFQ